MITLDDTTDLVFNIEGPHTSVAERDGMFAITPTSPMPFSDYAKVFSNTPFFIVSSVMAVQEEDVLRIDSAPTQISFPAKPVPEFFYIILPRDNDNAESPEDRSVLARITVPVRSGRKYTTKLGWAVTPSRVRPEEAE